MAFGFALVALGVVELLLRQREGSIRKSDRLDPGFIRHDPLLGWALSPRAEGSHAHHDFQATYHVDATGFRSSRPDGVVPMPGSRRHALVGDSFTFGLGVSDAEVTLRPAVATLAADPA